jgi:hypothetical protein
MPFVEYKLPVTTNNRFFVTTQLPQQTGLVQRHRAKRRGQDMLTFILPIFLIIVLVASLPIWRILAPYIEIA